MKCSFDLLHLADGVLGVSFAAGLNFNFSADSIHFSIGSTLVLIAGSAHDKPGSGRQVSSLRINLFGNVRIDHNELPTKMSMGLAVKALLGYGHQTEAIDAGLKGDDICLATSTASGKSLVYIALAADMILKDTHFKVVALFPARALIQDQLWKWKAVLNPLNLSFGFIDGSLPASIKDPA